MNKQFYSTIIVPLLLCLAHTPLSSQTPTANFANWKDNKKAAYTIIHDDYSNYVPGIFQYADPIATARDIKLCFGAITNYCGTTEWANARTMMGHGHECINHTHNHLCGGTANQCSGLSTYGVAQFATELGLSTQLIEQNTGVRPIFFIHPYDASSPAIISYLANLGYIGTRAGTQEVVNSSTFTDFMHLNFHVLNPSTPLSSLNQAVDQAISSGGYTVREFHGIADGSYAALSVASYTNHLNYVKTQMDNGNIWSATASEAITYKMQRDAYQPTVSYITLKGTITVSFNNLKSINTALLRTPATLNINLNGLVGTYNATQNGISIPSVKIGNTLTVNVYPHKGSVTLICSDCSPTSSIPNVTKLTAVPQTNGALVAWVNPTTTFNNVLVVAKEGSGFLTKPTTTSYTANANFTGNGDAFEGGKVVYQGTGTNINVTGLTTNKAYFFRVFVKNGTNWSSGVETSATPTGSVVNNLGCLQASYFSNRNLAGSAVATRFETAINYNWGTGKPNINGITANNFSIRWNGSFTATQTGLYKFTAKADDGVRLWVNNSLIINQWKDQSATAYTASISLIQNKTYDIKLEYYEKNGNAAVQLSWTVPTKISQIMPFSANCTGLASIQSNDLVTLDGQINNNQAALQWVVNTQKAVDYYQLEKRDEQGAFIPLSIINENNQNGIHLYSFMDEKLSNGDNDYRIQTIFADNNTPPQYSAVLKLNYIKPNTYNIFPNPAQDNVSIDLSEAVGKPVDIHIFSIIGKELYREQIASAANMPHVIAVNHFEMGQYMIQINVVGQRSVTRKLVIGQ